MSRVSDFMKGFAEVTGADTCGLSSENLPPLGSVPLSGNLAASMPGSSSSQPRMEHSLMGVGILLSSATNWRSLFQTDSVNRLKFCPPKVKNEKKSVFISKSIHDQDIQIWD